MTIGEKNGQMTDFSIVNKNTQKHKDKNLL